MKSSILLVLLVLLAGTTHTPAADAPSVKGAGGPAAALIELVSDSHWAWWEGSFDRYKKGKMQYWVEFYKDGTARVPWRDHAQYWEVTEPNILTLKGAGLNPDMHILVIDLATKSGSRANQSLHIKYEKPARKPSKFK